MRSIMIKYLVMSACCVLLWGAACGDTEQFEGAAMTVMSSSIASIDPISGSVGSAAYLDITNLDKSHKVVFERVAVALTEAEGVATPSGVAPAEGAKRYSFVVPNVGLGVMEVYVSDGTQKSTPVYFEITAPAGSQNVPPPSDVAEEEEGAGTLGFSGEGEDDKPSVDLSMCYCTYNYPDVISNAYLHYVPTELECDKSLGVCTDLSYGALVVSWNVANVKSAYVTINVNEVQPFIKIKSINKKEYPVGYMDFIGDPEKPHLGTKASSMSDMWKSLLDNPMKIFDSLDPKFENKINGDSMGTPFNYCTYDEHDNDEAKNDATRCFVKDIASLSGQDLYQINVFLPLLSGEKSKSGTWLFKTLKYYDNDKNYSSFKMYYKEWASGKIKSKEFKVPGVKD